MPPVTEKITLVAPWQTFKGDVGKLPVVPVNPKVVIVAAGVVIPLVREQPFASIIVVNVNGYGVAL